MAKVRLECQNCHHRWWETRSKSFLKGIDYPNMKIMPRRRCPECKKFTRPKIILVRS